MKAWISVVLKKAHTHAGSQYDMGTSIAVPEVDADWLEQQGIAVREVLATTGTDMNDSTPARNKK
ncbi:hypothetical protein BH11PSE12_BH11PSE12_08310 [soil metagenome]